MQYLQRLAARTDFKRIHGSHSAGMHLAGQRIDVAVAVNQNNGNFVRIRKGPYFPIVRRQEFMKGFRGDNGTRFARHILPALDQIELHPRTKAFPNAQAAVNVAVHDIVHQIGRIIKSVAKRLISHHSAGKAINAAAGQLQREIPVAV